MITIEDVSKEVAKDLGLDPHLVERVARIPWKYTRDEIANLSLDSVAHIYLGKIFLKEKRRTYLMSIDHPLTSK
jgi:hypothetical protein